MYCQNRISYRVQEGDSLYKIAKQFHTTVTELILLNTGANPYNLQIGMRLTVCPGEGYEGNEGQPDTSGSRQNNRSGGSQTNNSSGMTDRMSTDNSGRMTDRMSTDNSSGGMTNNNAGERGGIQGGVIVIPGNRPQNRPQIGTGTESSLRERMRMAWLNHITLVKFYLLSFFENLPGQSAWKNAVMQNAEEILGLFAQSYPDSVMQRLRSLFLQHLKLTDEVAASLKADPAASGTDMENWYINAEEIASLISRQTPAIEETALRSLLYDHLDMERQQMEAYLDGDYKTDVEIYLNSQKKIMELADMLASGLMAR